ncbi:uncharacterized protein RCO7_06692 [Rhynchosporium graminicola]|uniref:Uncharacterized protein n=1 Tax=Rhynchosporium graminicola TaxID=2792576 RepID=A0A1E1JYG0_9HELO|nr:uncharacterized protein RCO7_06692 [Rhynchosporium commune]
MATQTALALVEIAKPLKKITVPIPEPKEHELLVKISVPGIIPVDQKIRVEIRTTPAASSPSYRASTWSAKSWNRLYLASPINSLAVITNTHFSTNYTPLLYRKNISDADAALCPVNAFTSAVALFSGGGPSSNFGFPFPGAVESGTIDCEAVTLIGRVVVTASLESEKELRSYGATHVFDRRASDLADRVRALDGDELVYLYDTFSGGDHTFGVSLLSTSKKGTLLHLVPRKFDEAIAKQKESWV